MPDKSTLLKTFNIQLFAFLDDVIEIFPENTDIAIARKSFETIKKANPTIIAKVWLSYIYTPYKEVIDGGDITFIYEKDYANDLNSVANSGEVLRVIDTLREPIRTMSDTNKGHTMKYIQLLSKLSFMYSQA
jgi:hypothetical protein